MTEEDEKRLGELLENICLNNNSKAPHYILLLLLAKAAREFRETGEFHNGDAVQVDHNSRWVDARYIGLCENNSYALCRVDVGIGYEYLTFLLKDIRLKPKTELRQKSVCALAKALDDGGWKADDCGWFTKSGRQTFTPSMWKMCGKPKSDRYAYEPEWLEEVEI